MRSSVRTRKARRLQTAESRANEAGSWRARSVSTWRRISSGIREMGQGGAGESSVGGSAGEIERLEKEDMRLAVEGDGTDLAFGFISDIEGVATAAAVVRGVAALFLLYFSWTLASS
jgi:hypothetical protein